MKDYHKEGKISFAGIEKEGYIENMSEWMNDDETTYYMVTGLYPGNKDLLAEEYDELIIGSNVIFFIKYGGNIIGITGLYNISWQARFAEFRILIGGKGIHNKGIGTIATKFIVKYAFEKLNLNKVWLGVNIENKGAVRCYEKAGFQKEGVLRQEIFRNNKYYDAVRMSILLEDFKKR
jgi:RimJ/RimL family protein N-acetyltransferase